MLTLGLHVKCNISTANCVHICSCEIEIRIKRPYNYQNRIIAAHDLSLSPMTSQLIPMTNLTFIFQFLIF